MSWRAQLSKNMKMIGFYIHPQAAHSKNVLKFIEGHYADLKALNPLTNILVRDSPTIEEPYVIGYYDYASFEERKLGNMSVEQIESVVKNLVELGATKPQLPKDNNFFDIKREDEPEVKGLRN